MPIKRRPRLRRLAGGNSHMVNQHTKVIDIYDRVYVVKGVAPSLGVEVNDGGGDHVMVPEFIERVSSSVGN